MDRIAFREAVARSGCDMATGVPMSGATTFRIGGPADYMISLPSAQHAAQAIRLCREYGVPWMVIGNGSNLLFGDGGFRGAVLRLDPNTQPPAAREDGTVVCGAGVPLQRLCRFAQENALSGLEFAYGIPGTVGGAVYMDAGAYGGEMADVVVSADCLVPQADGSIAAKTLSREALELGYRHSALMDSRETIVTAVTVRLTPGDPEQIADKMKELIGRRKEKQPLEYPSAGSFFKRPTGYYAGALIEGAGLKGYRVGDAQISEKHAGFVINRGHATADEVLRLCRDVQRKVFAEQGVRLEPEVRFVGDFGER